MARGKAAALEESGADFVLTKNFGWIENGKHLFLPAGHEFRQEEDARLISFLHQLGAPLKAL